MRALVWILLALVPISAHANCEALKSGQTAQFTQVTPHHCQASKTLGGLQHFCFWQFDFRAAAAQDFAKQLSTSVSGCGAVVVAQSSPVNHPDTFDQVRYDLAGDGVSISIKDKTALSKTLVFLSLTVEP